MLCPQHICPVTSYNSVYDMLIENSYKSLSWVDVKTPTSEEARQLIDEYGIHPRVAEEILSPTTKPKLDVYDDYVYLVLHFPAIRHTHSNERNQEVDFILGKKFLITVHYDTVDSLHKFATEFEVNSITAHKQKGVRPHAGFIFYSMIGKLYHSLQNELDYIESRLQQIEDNVFTGKERLMVRALSESSRNLLDMEQTIEGHERALKDLLNEGQRLFGDTFIHELQDILHYYHTVYGRIKDQREFLAELRTTNDSLLSTKQNETTKVLTLFAALTLPLSLLAAIFGMNTHATPFIGHPADFWIVIGLMVLLTGLLFAFLKYKKWL